MQICIANDKFKGSISAAEAARSIRKGLLSANPGLDTVISPMADGGDGTLQILASMLESTTVEITCCDPLMRPKNVPVLFFDGGRTAFIEMASVSGLQLLPPEERNPMKTSTYGLGEAILKILDAGGIRKIIIGIGGSATNDGGTGMLEALGVRFFDKSGSIMHMNGGSLSLIGHMETCGMDNRIAGTEIIAATDVTNPLTGPEGATMVFSHQKGADKKTANMLEEGMINFRERCIDIFRKDPGGFKGSGAAGGTAASVCTFLNGKLTSGAKMIAEITGLEEKIASSDIVISGEGRFDSQSLGGKVVTEVDCLCRKHGKPLWIFCGENRTSAEEYSSSSIQKIFSISDIEYDRRKSMENPEKYLEKLAAYAAKTISFD